MLLKNLAIVLILSVVAAAPAFATVDDVHDSKTKATTEETKANDNAAVTRESEQNDPNQIRKEADRIATERDGTTSNDLSKEGNSLIANKLRAAQNSTQKDTLTARIAEKCIGVCDRLLINTQKDQEATVALLKENPANGQLELENISNLRQVLSKVRAEDMGRVRKMIRGFRTYLLGLRLKHSNASVDTLRDAITTYAQSIAGDNWAQIEHDAGVLMAHNPSLSERDAKIQAAKALIQAKHPSMRPDIVDEIAREIVDQKSCV